MTSTTMLSSEAGKEVTQLKTGDFFGEIGILNLSGGVNKRVATVLSFGYSEVFTLHGDDVLQAMEYYPEAKKLLHMYGKQRFEQSRKHSGPHLTSQTSSTELGRIEARPRRPTRSKSTTEMPVASTAPSLVTSPTRYVDKNVNEKCRHPLESVEELSSEDDSFSENDISGMDLASLREKFKLVADESKEQKKVIKKLQLETKAKDCDVKQLQEDVTLLMVKPDKLYFQNTSEELNLFKLTTEQT
ncbi:unnamed protein product [Clavelina lepadiformis]|uniref:Cyclic nucleotide-binding domain-containing protein n=1 Tax=Clavelina lepadiformis TaxID=159417 RepID=A0ABP0GJL3_CLALP